MKPFQLTEAERKLCVDCVYDRLVKVCGDGVAATGRRERKAVLLERKRLMNLICTLEGKLIDFSCLEP